MYIIYICVIYNKYTYIKASIMSIKIVHAHTHFQKSNQHLPHAFEGKSNSVIFLSVSRKIQYRELTQKVINKNKHIWHGKLTVALPF